VFVATGRFSSSLNMVVFEREKIRKLPLQKTCEITVICILSAIITIYTVYDLKKDIESNTGS
jgi:hypothetical protein